LFAETLKQAAKYLAASFQLCVAPTIIAHLFLQKFSKLKMFIKKIN